MEAVHVVGAGGIGCAIGYALRAAGVPVVVVEAHPAKLGAGRRDGLRVDDRPPLRVDFVPFSCWQPPAAGTVLLCVKCYDNAAVLARLPPGAAVVPVQNGFDPVLDAFGHATEGIASFVSQCAPDRPHTRITRPGVLYLGPRDGTPTTGEPDWLAPLGESARRERLFRVVTVPRIGPIKHTKLMYNAAISPLTAAAGIDNGKLLSVPTARALFFALIRENYHILKSAGVPLGTVGPFRPATVAWILRRRWLAVAMAKFFEPSLRGTYCSMAGEIAKGRTELDNYTGYLLRLAERHGVAAPLNRAVYERVRRMTAERAAPRREILDELAARLREAQV